ncbi:hypothetical protein, partial [Paenibacillus sp. P3E]|uniref:hypothetical protein n=1 Tax=Paenibacillus sp. P3E TaxID=1349435 RepID=UPI001C4A5D9B
LEGVRRIIQNRHMEHYKLTKLFGGDSPYVNKMSEILKELGFIRDVLTKYTITKRYKSESIDIALSKFKLIYKIESELIESYTVQINY